MISASEIRIGVVIAGDSIIEDVVVNHLVKLAGLAPSNIVIKRVPNETQVVMGVLFFAEYTEVDGVVAIANNASHDWLLCMQKALYDLQIQWNMPIEIGGGYGAMAAESVVRMVQLQYDMAGELPVERSTPLSANRKDNIN
jgi:6,7-dimethyl-8-ribityllumazine synthase